MTEEGRPEREAGFLAPPARPVPAGPPAPAASPSPTGPAAPLAPAPVEPPQPLPVPIPLATTRGLLAASFDLLLGSGRDMRRASFYIGLITLVTVGPFVLASLAREAVGFDMTFTQYYELVDASVGPISVLGFLALFGFLVALVESRTVAAAILGASVAGRPISIRRAVARSRRTFWRAIVASIVVSIPVALAQTIAGQVVQALLNLGVDAAAQTSVITSTLVSAVVGGPFAYVLAGVVLGDVDSFEAVRRSFRVFRARKMAAAVVAVFETLTALLLLFGLEAGLGLVLRVFDTLGLGVGSDAGGLAVTMVGVTAIVFAFGTLLFTVMAITIAPQVVMFVGLTHATIGVDRVRAGGPDDPDTRRPGVARFRWLTLPMLLAVALGALVLGLAVVSMTG